jgi:hypothetical protein
MRVSWVSNVLTGHELSASSNYLNDRRGDFHTARDYRVFSDEKHEESV